MAGGSSRRNEGVYTDVVEAQMFTDPRAYWNFRNAVSNTDRFALSDGVRQFLDEFRSQLPERQRIVPKGFSFFRAANDYEERVDDDTGTPRFSACGENRMLPQLQFAVEGRANPQGIVVLYVATSSKTAISEIRPWVGDLISVVRMQTTAERKLVDLSLLAGRYHSHMWHQVTGFLRETPLSEKEVNEIVWAEIDNAFSRPVGRMTTRAEYVPTQILASVVKSAGYDGLAYKSAFGDETGFNVALFSTEHIRIKSGHLFEVEAIEFRSSEIGNPWFRQDPPEEA